MLARCVILCVLLPVLAAAVVCSPLGLNLSAQVFWYVIISAGLFGCPFAAEMYQHRLSERRIRNIFHPDL